MIWFDEEFNLDGQPDDGLHTVNLKGGYLPPDSGNPTVILRLTIMGLDDIATVVTIFSLSPSMMRHEEPSPDDILEKYNHKVVKIRKLIESMSFSELLGWAKRKSTP